MAASRPDPERAPAVTTVDDRALDGEPESAVRRAPFSDNPQVGARGQRTQQRILDAALDVFGERGYHRSGIAHITEVAGCSRASFYQYFSSKEDVFRHLTGQVARQLSASTETLDPVTADLAGWQSIRAWVGRHADIYERYESVFRAFQAAAESDEVVGPGAMRTVERNVARFQSKVAATPLPPRKLDPVVRLLLESLTRVHETALVLRRAVPAAYPDDRVEDALADVVHRSLFGVIADVNVHPPAAQRPPSLGFGPIMQEALDRHDTGPDLTAAGKRTLTALEDAGRSVFVSRGYYGTRIDDVVAAAGVSHGAFYRYFQGKDHLAHVLAVRAIRNVSTALTDIPPADHDGSPDRATLRRWLRRYNASQSNETAMIRVWVDASYDDPTLGPDSAAALDWGRRSLARFLRPRDFGDVDTEAVVMVALLSAFGSSERPADITDAAAHIIERGLLGR
jgi:AcrR family transcriptional regulator